MLTNNPFEESYQQASSAPFVDAAAESPYMPPPVVPVAPTTFGSLPAAGAAAHTPSPHVSSPLRHSVGMERATLAKFRVDAPFKGKEVMRPITYFPIYAEVLVDNDGQFTAPDVPKCPFWHYMETGVKRSDWTRGNCAMVERRYSEVLDLRELLVRQFPILIIPPLPAKNSVKDIETYFSAGDAIARQRHNLQFFLKEIAAMPELVFFSEWVPSFFLDPRDTFETGTLVRMRQALRDMRLANKVVDDHSHYRRTFAEEAADKITAASTKIVRSVASMLWGGGGGGSSNDQSHGAAAAADSSSSLSGAGYNWTTLSAEDRAEAMNWESLFQSLSRRRKALKKTSRCFEAYLSATHSKVVEQQKVAQAFEGYEATLQESAAFSKLGESCRLAVTLLDEVSDKEKEFSEGKYLNVCLRLTFESNFIDAVLDSIDHILCLYQWLSRSVYDANDQAHLDTRKYTLDISQALHDDYNSRYKKYFIRRMRNLIREQILRPSMEMASSAESIIARSPFTHMIQDNDYCSGDTMSS